MRVGGVTTWLVVITALLACLVAIGLRPGEPLAAGTTSQSPWFQVRVEKPASNRPLGGLLGLIPSDDLAFSSASLGAAIGVVARHRLELKAEGWSLSIETDAAGRVAPETRLVFPSWLRRGDDPKPVALRCRPADRNVKITGFKGWRSRVESWDSDIGHVRLTTPPDADEFTGQFLVELATCENVASGRPLEWPNAPLIVRGRFDRLPTRAAAATRPLP
jgi:hypothetical protein